MLGYLSYGLIGIYVATYQYEDSPNFQRRYSSRFQIIQTKIGSFFFLISAPKSITNSVEISKCLQHKNKTNI